MTLKLALATPLAALSLLVAGSASAAIVTTPLNVREAPNSSSAVLDVLDEGTEVECTDMVGNWCELLDGEGYVYSAYLDFDEVSAIVVEDDDDFVDYIDDDIYDDIDDDFDDDFDDDY